jgi:hypothetical protein
VDLVHGLRPVRAGVRQPEALPAALVVLAQAEPLGAGLQHSVQRDKLERVQLGRRAEQQPARVGRAPFGAVVGPGGVLAGGVQRLRGRVARRLPGQDGPRQRQLAPGLAHGRLQPGAQGRPVEGQRGLRLVLAQRAALHELPLGVVQRRQGVRRLSQGRRLRLDPEEPGDELLDRGPEGQEEVALGLTPQRLGRRAPCRQPSGQLGLRLGQPGREGRVDALDALAAIEVGQGKAHRQPELGPVGGRGGRWHGGVSGRAPRGLGGGCGAAGDCSMGV